MMLNFLLTNLYYGRMDSQLFRDRYYTVFVSMSNMPIDKYTTNELHNFKQPKQNNKKKSN